MQVAPADVEGAGLLDVSLETYSALGVVEEALGPEHLHRYLLNLRAGLGPPRTRAAPPLLQATDSLAFSRRGPFALYALSQYIGKEKVNEALQHLLAKYRSGTPPLATSRDLYQQLQAVTPDSFQSLLHDLFETNTFWEFKTQRATAQQTATGAWQVTLNVRARKVVADSAGVETETPMNEWVQIGVFAPGPDGDPLGVPLYVQMQRIRAGEQTITVTVPRKPVLAGIDPYHLLDWEDRGNEDHVDGVEIEK